MNPIGISIHNTYNNASAKNEISYMKSNNNKVSFHIAVDDVEAIQGLPLDRNSWSWPQVLHVGALQDDLFGFPEPGDALVDAFEVYVEAQSGGGVGLRVGVEQQHLLAQQGQRCCEVDGRCGLAHAAFLIR